MNVMLEYYGRHNTLRDQQRPRITPRDQQRPPLLQGISSAPRYSSGGKGAAPPDKFLGYL